MPLFKKKDNEPRWNHEMAQFVEEEYTRRQNEQKPWSLQWRLNTEFLNGNQYLDINPVSLTIQEVPKLYWYQERESFNQIATIHETRVAKLTRQKPMLKNRPASLDESDVAASKVTSKLLQSTWHDQHMDNVYNDFVSWLELCGTAFLKPIWNKQKGRVVFRGMVPKQEEVERDDEDTPEEADPVFKAEMEEIEMREGDIETCVVPAFEFFPDSPWRDNLSQCRSVIHARAYHVDEIEETWGVRVEPESVDVMTLSRTSVGISGMGYGYGTASATPTRLQNHAIVKEYYERPSKRYPEGRFIVVASGKTLHAGTMPYQLGEDGEREFPFDHCVCIPRPGCIWGNSIVERLIPVQRRYNALRNRKAEYLNLVAIGQWYEPEGSIDEDTELNNAPGNVIRHKDGINKPEPVQFPSLPSSFENEIETLLAEFTAISGVSELSRMSEAPSGVKSGVALSIANEQDDTRIANTVSRIANSIVTLGKYWIRLYRQFSTGPRIARSVGNDMDVEVMQWSASQLKSDDVIVENSSALAETPAQRRQMVFDLLGTGIFNRPETNPFDEESKRRIFEMLEFGNWESGNDDMPMLQKRKAMKENQMLLQGQPPQIMDYDDHAIHVEQHNRFRMQAEYEDILRSPAGPMVDQIMRLHVAQHIQGMVRSAQAQMPQPQLPPEQNAG